jgi:hypothetical protein
MRQHRPALSNSRSSAADVSRRSLLQAVAGLVLLRRAPNAVESRAAQIVQAYSDQGVHRTATFVDERSANWLVHEVSDARLTPIKESFPLNRIDIADCFVEVGPRRIAAVPLFDGSFTESAGVVGRLATHAADAEIALLDLTPNTAGAGAVGTARRRKAHRAIVCVTRGGRPGLCPSNADSFTSPFGPPVVQISSEEGDWLVERASRGITVRVVAQVKRSPATAINVTAVVAGRDRTLPPLVIMTPRSGWYSCASERGGGIACWIELMRAMRDSNPARDIIFVASSGHELGHLGINAFVDQRPGIVANSAGWMHFGANIGAATDPANTVQSSDDESESRLMKAMTSAGLLVDRRVPRGTIPGGEAEVIHQGGGKYVSVIGRNGLFHNPADRGAETVDAAAIARFVDAFVTVATAIAS